MALPGGPKRSKRVVGLLKIVITVGALAATSIGAVALNNHAAALGGKADSAGFSAQLAAAASELWLMVDAPADARPADSAPCAPAERDASADGRALAR